MDKKLIKLSGLFILIFILSAMSFKTITENEFIKFLKSKLQLYTEVLPKEKLYLHFDKPFYFPGDNIWFSGYLTEMETGKLSKNSEILYVELIDPKGSVIMKHNIVLNDGLSNGDFHIDKEVSGGIYKVKAYTNWMLNFGDNYIFEKEIQVQKVVLPKLLMKLDFESEAYGAGDIVRAKIELSTTDNKNLANKEFTFVSQIAGEEGKVYTAKTDDEGNAYVEFELSEDIKSTDGLLNVMIDHEGNTESISGSVPIILHKIDLQFFPEGGDMIQNIKTRVAFKAVNEQNKAADIDGQIVDEKGNVLVRFSSYKFGMGAFDLKPEKNKKYFAKIIRPKGIDTTYNLPQVLIKGFQLNVIRQYKTGLDLMINSPFDAEISLIAQVANQIYYAESIILNAGENIHKINTEKFPIGITQITLFDNKNIERCERLVFVNKHKQLNVSISTDKEKYLPREKVKMTINTTDEKDLPIPANLSLSVVDEKLVSFADDKSDNIKSYLLMSSDLKGKIQEPNFYFNDEEPKADTALDYVMMTHGWRHFVWDDVISGEESKLMSMQKYNVEKCNITGNVLHLNNSKPAKGVKVKIKGTNKYVYTNERGEFEFKNIDPFGFYTLEIKESLMFTDLLFLNKKIPAAKINTRLYQNYSKQFQNKKKEKPIENFEGGIISGIVANEEGESLPGTTVFVKGTTVGTMSLFDGSFSINVPKGSQYLVFSYIGYETVEMPITGSIVNVSLFSDVDIQEVVVTALGISKSKKVLGYSVTEVRADEIIRYGYNNVLDAIQGKVAGVNIINTGGSVGASSYITIRGAASMPGNKQPLFVVDGIPFSDFQYDVSGKRTYYNPVADINPNDVESIEVIKGIGGAALYGSRAANGVIIITTKKRNNYPYYHYYANNYYSPRQSRKRALKNMEKRVSTCVVFSNDLYRVREFYSPNYKFNKQPDVRNDFRTTVYWEPNLKTDKSGKAELTFYNTDEISSFKTTVEGIGIDGSIGREEHIYYTQLPFNLDVKLPAYFSYDDIVSVPITLKNKTDNNITGVLLLKENKHLELLSGLDSIQKIFSNETKTICAKFKVCRIPGKSKLNISFKGKGLNDAFETEFEVKPKGFPVTKSFSGNDKVSEFKFYINDLVENSITCQLSVYPDVVSELFSGTESILRQPYGCFEQVSSSNYPNIVALQYMYETGQIDEDIEKRALSYLKDGYKKLTAYETPTKGYQWWGKSPGHGPLSAYGLMQFNDMKDVLPDIVKNSMIERTHKWLLKQKDNLGNFKLQRGLDGFSGLKQEIANAYIVYALSETGYKDFQKELNNVYNESVQSNDAYRLALIANIMYNLKDIEKAENVMQKLKRQYEKHGLGHFKADKSVVNAYGSSLQTEITALYVTAILKSQNPDLQVLNASVKFLISKRSNYGGFGSTQSTILALKALTEYSKYAKHTKESGKIMVYINGKEVATKHYEKGAKGEILLPGLEEFLKEGENIVKIVFSETKSALPFSMNTSWATYTPDASTDCRINIETNLSKKKIRQGETVRLSTKLKNMYSDGISSPIAIVGIPAGLSINPKQMKELQEKEIFDFYEIKGNTVIFYYTEFAPKAEKIINLDLKAEIPGTYLAPASSAYLYYTNEYKDWKQGETIIIN
ncbi:MAG: TonB-dependent receptor plug domain-containing protein [Bacteroidales bacterium]|nr:TonB-dependent receptor plug domain-containing protein [Bacteroidales bacterium]